MIRCQRRNALCGRRAADVAVGHETRLVVLYGVVRACLAPGSSAERSGPAPIGIASERTSDEAGDAER